MLANAPGFLSLYAAREVHFEEVYRDILHRAYLPPLRGPLPAPQKRLLKNLQEVIGGEVVVEGEEFFLHVEQGKIEFTLLAEGFRKLGLLWLLIRNGSLPDGSVLFWDEPETNLNPKMFQTVINVLLELQRSGVQVFFATHDYVILKELDLQMTEEDAVAFTPCTGMKKPAKSPAAPPGNTWTSGQTPLTKPLTTSTTVKLSVGGVPHDRVH